MKEKMPTIEQLPHTLEDSFDGKTGGADVDAVDENKLNSECLPIDHADKPRRQWSQERKTQQKEEVLERKKEFVQKLFGEHMAKRISPQLKGKIFTQEEFAKIPEDSSGTLYFYNSENGNFCKISTRSLRSAGLDFGVGNGKMFSDSPKEALLECFKDELDSGFFQLDDFGQKSGTTTSEKIRTERKISEKMVHISFDRANYYLKGKEYPGTDIEIKRENDQAVMLTPELVAFVGKRHGDDYIKCTMKLLSEDELKERLEPKGKNGFVYVNAQEVAQRISPWGVAENNPKREDETAVDYAERIRAISEIGFIRKISDELSKETQIGMHNLSLKEQQWLATYAYHNEKKLPELFEFARKYSIDSLKSFLALEYGEENGDKVMAIGEGLANEESKEVFKEYSQALVKAEHFRLLFRNSEIIQHAPFLKEINKDLPNQICEAISRRAKDIVNVAYALAIDDKISTKFYGRQEINCQNINEVIRALNILTDSLDKLEAVLQPANQEVNYNVEYLNSSQAATTSHHFKLNNKKSNQESYLTIQTKAEPQKDEDRDAAKEYDGEARINFLFNNQPISEFIVDPSRADAVSIRIDREGWIRKNGELAKDENGKPIHDPTIEDTEISLDMGSVYHEDKNIDNAVLGRMVALGNVLDIKYADEKHKKDPQYFHNRESFSKELADKKTFAEIVKFIEKLIEEKFGL